MRFLATDLPAETLEPYWPKIRSRLRSIFFEGERDIPMSPRQREAVLRDGLPGLVDTAADNASKGIWAWFDPKSQRDDLARVHGEGRIPTRRLFGFENFVRSSGNVDGRDPQSGASVEAITSSISSALTPFSTAMLRARGASPKATSRSWSTRGELRRRHAAGDFWLGAVPDAGVGS